MISLASSKRARRRATVPVLRVIDAGYEELLVPD
jgi:hypothetical protein